MPTYEYRCPNGHDFEKFYRTISAAQSEVPCPKCAAIGVRHLSAGAGLLFKGSGFYLTDYGKNAHATRGDVKAASPGGHDAKSGSEAGASGASGSEPGKGSASGGSDAKAGTSAPSGAEKSTPKKGD
ncbi:MAG: FmdB family zinc ribbon protein [Gemmatimonadaceae bacterium]